MPTVAGQLKYFDFVGQCGLSLHLSDLASWDMPESASFVGTITHTPTKDGSMRTDLQGQLCASQGEAAAPHAGLVASSKKQGLVLDFLGDMKVPESLAVPAAAAAVAGAAGAIAPTQQTLCLNGFITRPSYPGGSAGGALPNIVQDVLDGKTNQPITQLVLGTCERTASGVHLCGSASYTTAAVQGTQGMQSNPLQHAVAAVTAVASGSASSAVTEAQSPLHKKRKRVPKRTERKEAMQIDLTTEQEEEEEQDRREVKQAGAVPAPAPVPAPTPAPTPAPAPAPAPAAEGMLAIAGVHMRRGALTPTLSSTLFQEMTQRQPVPWQKKPWGRGFLPRQVWHFEPGVCGLLDQVLLEVARSCHFQVAGVFCNWYQHGKDWTPFHKDSYGGDVLTLSLGASRRFQFKRDSDKSVTTETLHSGDLVYFTQGVNDNYTHAIPKTSAKDQQQGRISIVLFGDTAHGHTPLNTGAAAPARPISAATLQAVPSQLYQHGSASSSSAASSSSSSSSSSS